MRLKPLLLAACLALLPPCGVAEPGADFLAEAVASPSRTPEYRARDVYRHPEQTLRFFGITPQMTVVEVWPGEGSYTEILAPYLRDAGHYYAAGAAASQPDASANAVRSAATFQAKLDADPERYGKVTVTEFRAPDVVDICPPGTADLVLSFDSVHNWMTVRAEQDAFNAFYRALKPGGVLGVVEHRAWPYTTIEQTRKTGYVNEEYVKALAANAGFEFVAASPVNANPRDKKDYPQGVWTLPPTLALGDQDKARYLKIGESDRMTLKFRRPAAGE
ncbi:MAG: class I SAM-dependent methyltransferase [Nevskia sp.]|nr:class I SAM-dependent methyltransferase [Nevskia sp.]